MGCSRGGERPPPLEREYTFTAHELAPYYTGERTSFTFAVAGHDDVGNYSAARSYTYTLRIAP